MKQYKYSLFALAAVAVMFVACTAEDLDTASDSLSFTVTDAGAHACTRATVDGATYTTVFEEGDKAGVYGVRGGKVVDGMNNMLLTYTANGTWELESSLSYSEDIADVKFYAYYPYSESMTFDASVQSPFAQAVDAFEPSSSQGTKSAFNSSDLMITGAATIGSQLHNVNLVMSHCMSIAKIELPNSSYTFTNDGIGTYVVAKSEDASFKLDDKIVTPYFDEQQQSYYLIVKPNTESTLSASFSKNGEPCTAYMRTLSQVGIGQYAEYVIDGGVNFTSFTLQVGDYYLSDGRLVSKDAELTEALKSMVVGVVYKLSVPSDVTADHSSCTHALIVSAAEATAKWGTDGSTTSAENSAGFKTWYTNYDMEVLGTSTPKTDETTLMEIGYTQTKAWESIQNGTVTLSGYSKNFCDIMQTTLAEQRQNAALPTVACQWYTPSLRDLININAELEAVNGSLSKIGAAELTADTPYWSNQMSNQTGLWPYTFGTGIAKRCTFKDARVYRFISAF